MAIERHQISHGAIRPRLLLADDDEVLSAMLRSYLDREGFEATVANNGDSALSRMAAEDFDLLVLDLMMPGKDGFAVLRELRRQHATPVLMLTARDEDFDGIVCLELGADDYLAKPCNLKVLSTRIRALLRRANHYGATNAMQTVMEGDVILYSGSRHATCCGADIPLTSKEFSLLEVLLRNAGRVVPRWELSQKALGRPLGPYDRSLDMHLSHLRKKLGPLADSSERIVTVRGTGYQYVS